MHFDLTADQKLLVDTVAAFVKRDLPITRMRAMRNDALGYSRHTWRKMGELGWLALPFPEEVGGMGCRFVDVALVLEEFGRTLVSEPYLASVVLAGTALARAGTGEQRARYLVPLIEGEATLALAYAERHARFDVARVATRATRLPNGGYRVQGEKVFVLNGHAADGLVVSARSSGGVAERAGVSLFAFERQMPGVTTRPIRTMDGQRAAIVELDVELAPDCLLGQEGEAWPLLEELMDLGAAATCAEGAGVARTVLDMTVGYLGQREQFGVKIGSFQALQHRAVDMFVRSELIKSMAIMASIKVAERDPLERAAAVSAAKVELASGGRFVTQQAIQLHGGIGVTDEHDVGLYFKRMHTLATLFGDEEHHLDRYANLPRFMAGIEGDGGEANAGA